MQKVVGSKPISSTLRSGINPERGYFFAGLVAAEGSFTVTTARRTTDELPPLRFVFEVRMASRDRPLLIELRKLLGFGSVTDSPPRKERWLPITTLRLSSRRAHFASTVPFMDEFLLPPARKRVQYDQWKSSLLAYDLERPRKVGRSLCSKEACDRPVRGRGLCRSHYYRATGY